MANVSIYSALKFRCVRPAIEDRLVSCSPSSTSTPFIRKKSLMNWERKIVRIQARTIPYISTPSGPVNCLVDWSPAIHFAGNLSFWDRFSFKIQMKLVKLA